MSYLSSFLKAPEKFLRMKSVPLRYKLDNAFYKKSRWLLDLNKFKDVHKGKPLLVVANGPSLNKTPHNLLTKFNSIGLNKINLFFNKTNWRPNYILAVNNHVIKQNLNFYKNTNIPCFIAYKARWLFWGKYPENIHFLNLLNSFSFSSDCASGICAGATVTFSALQFAFFLGGNPVIIVGLDHSYSFSGKPLETSIASGAEKNHFSPNYFSYGQLWGNPDLIQSEENYRNAYAFFKANKRNIFDATVDGKCTIFPKISIDEALGF